jgi:hypothetical protein
MALEASELAQYLIGRAVVGARSVVDGDWSAHDMSRRNRNFVVLRRSGPSFFVKQPVRDEPEASNSAASEARFYRCLAGDARLAALREFTPKLVMHDEHRAVLVVEHLNEARDLGDFLRASNLDARPLVMLGRALALLHGPNVAAALATASFHATNGPPWILSVAEADPRAFGELSGGERTLLGLLRGRPDVRSALLRLRSGWRRSAFVHHDLKLDNCLWSETPQRLHLVDWELAGPGDPAWDLGTVFQAIPTLAILLGAVQPTGSNPYAVALAPQQLQYTKVLLRAFFASYAQARGFAEREARDEIVRALAFSGARMILSAYEALHEASTMPPNARMLFETAARTLRDPYAVAAQVFGEG